MESRPTPQCRVKVRTKGMLEKGMVVDGHHFVPFTVGDGDVIQGWCSVSIVLWMEVKNI